MDPTAAGVTSVAGTPWGAAAWPGGVRVWKVFLDRPERPQWWRRLSRAERERALALAGPLDRRRYVAAHAALRTVLGRACAVPADRLRLTVDDAGRPSLDQGEGRPAPDFNLSHSDAWALVALAPPGVRVGVDVERVRSDLDHLALAHRLYQPEENERLLAAGDGLAGYFRLWTAKEAFVKATGNGLAGLSDVLVHEGEAGACEGSATSVRSRSLNGPVRWLDVAPGYAAAVVTIASTPAPRTG
ncbi:4'-phosphopantetheinyl transferase superfamily protein [Nonomuraea phyllanthi]|uniref:4'-phosphopantetheinyl transferase family protein n=1 Tax=Nonomuraea phyllanthi TaxID=2219224 RepID=UPI0012934966|nr:4'-phosphopantetheinyl transferase superfamily protein [Nonomuraea phyllanthi]QFY11917.1 4'-phosphopantetheinyl transferase superfamily protein [Nonomuraea phyllanthi]